MNETFVNVVLSLITRYVRWRQVPAQGSARCRYRQYNGPTESNIEAWPMWHCGPRWVFEAAACAHCCTVCTDPASSKEVPAGQKDLK